MVPLTVDTALDKAMRFVSGVLFGGMLVLGVAGFGEILTEGGFIVGAALFMAACGVIGVTHGERFFDGLVRVFRWLAHIAFW